jgi:predicted glycosyltransferase
LRDSVVNKHIIPDAVLLSGDAPAAGASQRRAQLRILMYSHDTFGLGHLRRCRTIAHALVEAFKGVHVLIVTGSQIAGAFDLKARVDFVKIPSVIKLYNGEYTSISQHINIDETIDWRTKIIHSTAECFAPDIFIVDKEPLGLKRELLPTLQYLKKRGCKLVVGLRDVLDDEELLAAEWGRNDTLHHIQRFYDDIWIYGPEGFWNAARFAASCWHGTALHIYRLFAARPAGASTAA